MFCFIVSVVSFSARANSVVNWDGPYEGSWYTPNNWDPDIVPTSSTWVVINRGNDGNPTAMPVIKNGFAEVNNVDIGVDRHAVLDISGAFFKVNDTIRLGVEATGRGTLNIRQSSIVITKRLDWGQGEGGLSLSLNSKIYITDPNGLDPNDLSRINNNILISGGGSMIIWAGYHVEDLEDIIAKGKVKGPGPTPTHFNVFYLYDQGVTVLSGPVISLIDLNFIVIFALPYLPS